MEKSQFRMEDHALDARLNRLTSLQTTALKTALTNLSGSSPVGGGAAPEREALTLFLLPLAEFGLTADHIIEMVRRIPEGFPFDHRSIYFDFRLRTWIKHIEPLTVAQCLQDYLENAESQQHGLDYLKRQWQAFLDRHQKA